MVQTWTKNIQVEGIGVRERESETERDRENSSQTLDYMSWLFLSSVEETVDIQKYKERAKENTKTERERGREKLETEIRGMLR